MASEETYEEMGREGGNGYVPMKRDSYNYMDMTLHEQSNSDGDGYFSANREDLSNEGKAIWLSDSPPPPHKPN